MNDLDIYHVFTKEGCPWGRQAIGLLKDENAPFKVTVFATSKELEQFKEEHGVTTTPQIFHKGSRVGGYTELAASFGVKVGDSSKRQESYQPVIAVFSVALALSFVSGLYSIMGFMGFSLSLLAMLKLMDLQSFKKSFANYDIVTQRFALYGYIYPFLELASGLGFLSGRVPAFAGMVALFAGITGGYSIIKAVYIDKQDLNCACVGGSSQVPLGVVSLSENAMMSIMGCVLIFT